MEDLGNRIRALEAENARLAGLLEWSCPACTFKNQSEHPWWKCDVCDVLRTHPDREAAADEAAAPLVAEVLEACEGTPSKKRRRDTLTPKMCDAARQVRKLEAARADAEALVVCTICRDAPRDVIYFPCTHIASCAACSADLDECPICREVIKTQLEVKLA